MIADAVNMPSTAVEASGNRYCGTDNAMPGDFLMALMGALLQQGGIENSSAENPGGLLFQQGEDVSNLLPEAPVAGIEGFGPQSRVPVIMSEILPGSEYNPAGGKNMENILLPSAGTLDSGRVTAAPEVLSQPGQAAPGVSLLGTAVSGQGTSGSAKAPAEGEMDVSLQVLEDVETGVNVQVQVDTGSSSGVKAPQPATNLQSPVPAGVTGVNTAVNSEEVLHADPIPEGEAEDYSPFRNSLPAAPAKNTVSVTEGEGENQHRTLAAVEEQKMGDPVKMPDFRWEKTGGINPAGRLTPSEGPSAQAAGYGRNEAVQGTRDASVSADPAEDGAVEMVSITDSDGAQGKESDARPGGFALQGDIQTSAGTQLSNITGRKLAAEIVPHVLNLLKNSEGEKSRVTVLRLKLEPENLGEIKIRLSFVKGELTAHFYTASGLVKDAVEGSLPQLRETLGQYNINLGEAGAYVGQEQQNRSGRFGGYQQWGSSGHTGINYPVSSAGDAVRGGPGNGSSALDLLI